jgi:hypothetical protein
MGRVITAAVGVTGSLALLIWLMQMGVLNPRLSFEDKIERRANISQALIPEYVSPRKNVTDGMLQAIMAMDIQAYENNKILMFGKVVTDTFRWYGMFDDTIGPGYHEHITHFTKPKIIGFMIYEMDGNMKFYDLPDSTPNSWSR